MLSEKQKTLCNKYGYITTKKGLLYSLWEENQVYNKYSDLFNQIPYYHVSLTNRLKYLYNKYSLKELDSLI